MQHDSNQPLLRHNSAPPVGHATARQCCSWVLCAVLDCCVSGLLSVCSPVLQGHLEDMLTNKHAHRVLMQLLAPDSHRYLPPAIYEIIHPAAKSMMVSAAAAAAAGAAGAAGLDEDEEEPDLMDAAGWGDDEDAGAEAQAGSEDGEGEGGSGSDEEEDAAEGEGSPAAQQAAAGEEAAAMVSKQLGESKKDPAVRRQELLGSGPDSLAAGLVRLCAEQAPALLASPVGGEVLVEVARGAAGGLLWQQHQAGVEAVHQALLQQLQQDVAALGSGAKQQPKQQHKGKKGKGGSSSGEAAGAAEPLLTHYYGSRALRRLLLAAGSDGDEGAAARAFAEQLWQQVLQGQCRALVGGHAEKVVAALLHCSVGAVEQAVAAELEPLVGGDVQQWAAKFLGPAPGGQQQQQQQQQQKGRGQQQAAAGKQSNGSSKQQAQQKPKKQKKH